MVSWLVTGEGERVDGEEIKDKAIVSSSVSSIISGAGLAGRFIRSTQDKGRCEGQGRGVSV